MYLFPQLSPRISLKIKMSENDNADTFHSDLGTDINTEFTRDVPLVTTLEIHLEQSNIRNPDNQAQTLRATRDRNLPNTGSDVVIAAAVPECNGAHPCVNLTQGFRCVRQTYTRQTRKRR